MPSGFHTRFLASLSCAISLLIASNALAVPLALSAGDNITFDTDTATYSGTVNGSGSLIGGVAHFGFDSVNLAAGATVTLQGGNPLSLVSYSNLSIDTTLDASGQGQVGRLGGFNGGNPGSPPQVGQGPGGGGVTTSAGGCCWGGGGGGYGGADGRDNFTGFVGAGGATCGDAAVTTLFGDSGGAGGGGCCGSVGNVGGAGGGAINIFAEGAVSFGPSAQLLVNGADGNPGNQNRTGGGGSGGSLRVGPALFNGREYIGFLSEVLVYDRALNQNEVNKVGVYIEQKYGLDTAYQIPEPATAGLIAAATLALGLRRRRQA